MVTSDEHRCAPANKPGSRRDSDFVETLRSRYRASRRILQGAGALGLLSELERAFLNPSRYVCGRAALSIALAMSLVVLSEGKAVGETTTRVSVGSAGEEGDLGSSRASLSADGRYVAFYSDASNLVPGDEPANDPDTCPTCTGVRDVFVRDWETGTTVRVSVRTDGTAGNDKSDRPSISGDGRYVAFISEADDLVPNDTNLLKDIFVRDRETGTTVRVSVSSEGVEGKGNSNRPSISDDGRYIAFYSDVFNLVPDDEPPFDSATCPDCTGVRDIFVHDRDPDGNGIVDEGNGVSTRIGVSTTGDFPDRDTGGPKFSADGSVVAMVGTATSLVAGDTNRSEDVFVRDLATAATTRVSVSSTGAQASSPTTILPDSQDGSISGDGRFVVFRSAGVNLARLDTNLVDDIFLHDRDVDQDGIFDEPGAIATRRISVSLTGAEALGASGGSKISADGSRVVYYSDATNLIVSDANVARDVFENIIPENRIVAENRPSVQPAPPIGS